MPAILVGQGVLPFALYILFRLIVIWRHIDEAIVVAKNAIKIDPNFSLAYFNLGVSAMHLRQFDLSKNSFDNILGKCKEPLIVLIVVFLINNNFTLTVLKNIPQLSTEGVLNMVGYGAVAIIIAITFFVLNIVSTQFI